MRLSLRYLQKFIKQKTYIFEDRSSMKKELAKTYVVFMTAGISFTCFMTYFGIPTPDIIYEFRCWTSPDFSEFVRTNGKLVQEVDLKSRLRNFRFHERTIEGARKFEDYRSTFVEHD